MYAFTPFANADWGSVYGGFIGFCVDFSVFDSGFWRLVIACTPIAHHNNNQHTTISIR